MNTTEQLLKQAKRLQARVEFLQKALVQLHAEVGAHHAALCQHLNGAVSQARGAPVGGPASGPERRALPRQPANQVLIELASVMDETEAFSGWIVDYNTGGLGIWVEKRVSTGTFVTVRPFKPVANFKWKEAEVKNCERDQDGWRLGCKLDEALSSDELGMLGLE